MPDEALAAAYADGYADAIRDAIDDLSNAPKVPLINPFHPQPRLADIDTELRRRAALRRRP